MNFLSVCSWLAALCAGLTSLNMLIDAPVKVPAGSSLVAWVHHYTRVAILVAITAASFLVSMWPLFGHRLTVSPFEVLLNCALTGYLMTHAPCPWWRYILYGERRKRETPYWPNDRRKRT